MSLSGRLCPRGARAAAINKLFFSDEFREDRSWTRKQMRLA
jgi:hypothetical protein